MAFKKMTEEIDAYKEFIDEVVGLNQSVQAEWVKNGRFPEVESNNERNEVLALLTEQQKNVLSDIIQESYKSGVHDLLVLLNDNSEIVHKGRRLAKEPFETEMHFDYVARSEGDSWPE